MIDMIISTRQNRDPLFLMKTLIVDFPVVTALSFFSITPSTQKYRRFISHNICGVFYSTRVIGLLEVSTVVASAYNRQGNLPFQKFRFDRINICIFFERYISKCSIWPAN